MQPSSGARYKQAPFICIPALPLLKDSFYSEAKGKATRRYDDLWCHTNIILMNFLFLLGIVPPCYPSVQYWQVSTSISPTANAAVTKVRRSGSELCTFCSFSGMSPSLIFHCQFFSPPLNFSYQCPVQHWVSKLWNPSPLPTETQFLY